MELWQAEPGQIPKLWPMVRGRIEYGLERSDGRLTMEGLYTHALSGEYDCHVVLADEDEVEGDDPERLIRAVFFTQCYQELNGDQVCSIVFLSGKNRVEWTWLVVSLETWALRNKIDRIEFFARRGWIKELRDYGYRPTHVLLEKNLRGEAHHGTQHTSTNDHDHDAHAHTGQ